ncbi:hypothetical protein [Vibrio genomosp. F10]|uniref:Uncharacterized protein n=1 Tax=Vibrio genomosp. F10 TaxID=723171 RepID=A0A1B9QZX4_9VIBR|nr:hypothetical protein [Vibrio genomosp. F10]OCH76694.1 hypothetical protein A6E14_08850 [Vibrio genomosp. F10]OEE87810.1 hypothetical protein A1QK_19275 [Vibrio genomosp. F10 str. 9ZD137]
MKTSMILAMSMLMLNTANASGLETNSLKTNSVNGQGALLSPQTEPMQAQRSLPNDPMSQWSYQAQDITETEEVRVSALRSLSASPSQNGLVAVSRGLKDASSAIREAAIVGAEPYPLEYRWRLVSPLLSDDSKQVRMTAAASLLKDRGTLDAASQQQLIDPATELIGHLKEQADDDSRLLLADVYRWTEQYELAEAQYLQSKQAVSNNPQVWLSLADNYRAQGMDEKAIDTLNQAIEALPSNAHFHFAKSLTLVRLEDKAEAAKESEIAATLAKTNSYYWYVHGVLQEAFNIDEATTAFETAYLISGGPEHLYAVCDIYVRNGNEKTDECMVELAKIAPSEVIDQLNNKKAQSL